MTADLMDMDFGAEPETLELGSTPVPSKPNGRGKLTGWLLKRKSEGVASRLFRSANRRYFTLDFEGQLFYYAHTEGNKMASLPVAFRELLGVEPFEASLNDGAIEEQECKGTATHGHTFRVPKISFGALKRPVAAEHHGFTLQTTGKEMELLCSTKEEAESWITAFQEAVAMGAESRGGIRAESGEKVDLSTSAGSSPKAPLSPRSDDVDSLPEISVPQSATEAAAKPHQASGEKKPNAQANMQAFGSEPLEDATKEAVKEPPRSGRRGLGGLLPRRLGRSRPAEAARSGSASGEVTSCDFEAALLREASEEAGDQAWGEARKENEKEAAAVATISEVTKRYEDKGRGLSLKERLAQMEFSDDEDE